MRLLEKRTEVENDASAPLESNRRTLKSASGKRPPEARSPGKEAIKPQQLCLGESRKESAHVHATLPAEVGTFAPLRIQDSAKFRQTFSHFCSFIFERVFNFCNYGSKFTNFDFLLVRKRSKSR